MSWTAILATYLPFLNHSTDISAGALLSLSSFRILFRGGESWSFVQTDVSNSDRFTFIFRVDENMGNEIQRMISDRFKFSLFYHPKTNKGACFRQKKKKTPYRQFVAHASLVYQLEK